MLSFFPEAWDLFYVYRHDFVREVANLSMDGCRGVILGLCPDDGFEHKLDKWCDFRWKGDASYRCVVQAAAIVFIAMTACIQEGSVALTPGTPTVVLPHWFALDVSAIACTCVLNPPRSRTLAALKATVCAAQQNRPVDPLMLLSLIHI